MQSEDELGTNYPAPVRQCLQRISSMEMNQLVKRYPFPKVHMTELLKQRAVDMIERGYEWTVKHGKPLNPPGRTYLFQPPCCKAQWDVGLGCSQPVNWTASLRTEVPFGNPITGGPWQKLNPDVGTYEGGTKY